MCREKQPWEFKPAAPEKISLSRYVVPHELYYYFSWFYLTSPYDFLQWQENCSWPLTVGHKLTEQNKIKQWSNPQVNLMKPKSQRAAHFCRQWSYLINFSLLFTFRAIFTQTNLIHWVYISSFPQFVHQAHMGRTVNRYVSVQLRMKSVTQSQGDIPVFLATMETAVISVSVFCTFVVIYPRDTNRVGHQSECQRANVNSSL